MEGAWHKGMNIENIYFAHFPNAFGSCVVTSMLHTRYSTTEPSEILRCRHQVLFCANQTAVELSTTEPLDEYPVCYLLICFSLLFFLKLNLYICMCWNQTPPFFFFLLKLNTLFLPFFFYRTIFFFGSKPELFFCFFFLV